jgi:hypothetical protein
VGLTSNLMSVPHNRHYEKMTMVSGTTCVSFTTIETCGDHIEKMDSYSLEYKCLHFIWLSWDRASWYFSVVKPIRCTIFRVYWISLYMFRTVFPSIIRNLRLYTQHQVYVIRERNSTSYPLASSQLTCMTYTWCCVYSLVFLMMDGETVRNM